VGAWLLGFAVGSWGCEPVWPPPPAVPVQVQGFDLDLQGAPVPSGMQVTDLYAERGILLENARTVDAGEYEDLVAESSPNVLGTAGGSPRLGTITVRFVRPSDGVTPGRTTKVGAFFLDVDDASEMTRLEAYDEADRLLGSVGVPVGEDGSRQYVEIEAEGIAYARCVLGEEGDGAALDDLSFASVPLDVFILEAYPAYDAERRLIEAYLRSLAAHGKEGDVYYAADATSGRYLSIRIQHTPEAFAQALQTPGAVVGFTGHSNFGLGALFSDLPDHSHIEWVSTLGDFMNVSSDLVGMAWPYLVQDQAYPNLGVQEDEIAQYPENYCTPIGVQRFPNDRGVGICETFGEVQGEGMDRYHYLVTGLVGEGVRLIVHGGAADLPSPLRYAVLYYRSCNSGAYYSESFQHGVLFYTTFDSLIGAQDVFVQGILLGWDRETLKRELNRRQNNNDYFDFTQDVPAERCDPGCT